MVLSFNQRAKVETTAQLSNHDCFFSFSPSLLTKLSSNLSESCQANKQTNNQKLIQQQFDSRLIRFIIKYLQLTVAGSR